MYISVTERPTHGDLASNLAGQQLQCNSLTSPYTWQRVYSMQREGLKGNSTNK